MTTFTRVYRAVSRDEFQQIARTGKFELPLAGPGLSPMEGKWFADTKVSAIAHGDALFGPQNFDLVQADVPDDAPSLYRHPNIDGRGPGRYLEIGDLAGVAPQPVR